MKNIRTTKRYGEIWQEYEPGDWCADCGALMVNGIVFGTFYAVDFADSVRSLHDATELLRKKLQDEEERHAALQSRCYEGFPSVSDGIFDALKDAQRDSELLDAILEAYASSESDFDEHDSAIERAIENAIAERGKR